MELSNVLLAFVITLFAGLSTGIGSIFAFFIKNPGTRFFSVSLGFSAGVMLYISFVELFNTANNTLIKYLGENPGSVLTVGGFFFGVLLIALIEKLLPNPDDPDIIIQDQEMKENQEKMEITPGNGSPKLLHLSRMAALVITIHNFPEGMATFASSLHSPSLGIAIAIAIAIHNIPEGVAVSLPVYYATGSRAKAFKFSFFSGLAEPLGALIGFLLLMPILNEVTLGILFAIVAGIIVFLSLNELLPTAIEYGGGNLPIYGLVSGMALMAVSLLIFC